MDKNTTQPREQAGERISYYRTPTWYSHSKMLERCQNPNHNQYKNYQARGISVCERWKNFQNFLEDMGERPEGKSLDRIDNDKGYYKENCRWAGPFEQARNQRRRKLVLDSAIGVAVMRLSGSGTKATAEEFGVSGSTVRDIVSGRCWPDALEEAKKIIGEKE